MLKQGPNGVILQTRLTSAGTRVYFYRTYLLRQEAKKWGHRIAAYAQESFSKVGRSSRTAGSRLELRDGNRDIVFIFSFDVGSSVLGLA